MHVCFKWSSLQIWLKCIVSALHVTCVVLLILLYEACLIPKSRDFLEELLTAQPVKKLLSFYGTVRFISMPTTARHWSLLSAG
jgi:hypothetical protein